MKYRKTREDQHTAYFKGLDLTADIRLAVLPSSEKRNVPAKIVSARILVHEMSLTMKPNDRHLRL